MLKNITWYTERTISEISLGGILILIVIRTIQYNMLKMRDKYLHTNCLAALANMSGHFRALHPYVAQRLVSLFETLARKHTRLDAQLKEPADSAVFVNVSTTPEDMLQDLSVLEEVLRMVLEILNSCLTNQLVYCPNLVYTLLYKRSVFEGFRSHHAFQDVIQNIDMVCALVPIRLCDVSHAVFVFRLSVSSPRVCSVSRSREASLGSMKCSRLYLKVPVSGPAID